jgi:hypothetical protein
LGVGEIELLVEKKSNMKRWSSRTTVIGQYGIVLVSIAYVLIVFFSLKPHHTFEIIVPLIIFTAILVLINWYFVIRYVEVYADYELKRLRIKRFLVNEFIYLDITSIASIKMMFGLPMRYSSAIGIYVIRYNDQNGKRKHFIFSRSVIENLDNEIKMFMNSEA